MRARRPAILRYRVEPLEPRLLLAADWAAGFVPSWTPEAEGLSPDTELAAALAAAPAPAVSESGSHDAQTLDLQALVRLHTSDESVPAPHSTEPVPDPGNPVRLELIVIDAGVEDQEALIADIEARGSGSVRYEIQLLAADEDGVQALSALLAGYRDLDAVHVVSHGSAGNVSLGDTQLNAASIDAYADAIRAWSAAFSDDADLLFYGCDLAASADGQSLLQSLAALTRADVAASTDPTGQALLGGDWDLEYRLGAIDSASAFSAQLQSTWSSVLAATFTVNTLNDTVDVAPGDGNALDASGNTSLRAAIMEANALAGSDTINLPSGSYLLSIAGDNENSSASGDLDITEALTITGAGAGSTTIDAQGIDRVMHALSKGIVVNDVTMRGGIAAGDFPDGGAMFIETGSAAHLQRVVLTGNWGQDGGAIFNNGALTVRDSTIDNNTAAQNGGALRNGSFVDLEGVTISNNTAGSAGGGVQQGMGGNATLTNVTISGNESSAGSGGGLRIQGTLTAMNVTVFDNTASGSGGGIAAGGGSPTITLSNSIVAGNTATSANDVSATVVSDGSNIVQDGTGSSGFSVPEIGVNPSLDPILKDNGGVTMTHALNGGSPAIDSVRAVAAPATDQRGYVRDGTPDIGAFEFAAMAPLDSDGDGLWDYREDADTDGDADPTTNPGPDTDGNATPNYLDNDDDGDGILTSAENADPNSDGDPRDAVDSDHDGQPDYLDAVTGASDGTVTSEQKISDTQGGLSATLELDDRFGRAIAGIGDLDGDGINDMAVGVNLDDDGGNNRGAVYILFLNADGTIKSEQKISSTAGGLPAVAADNDRFGRSVAGIGDLDGDGIIDLVVGANRNDDGGTDRGAVHILFLNADGTVKAQQTISNTTGGLGAALNDSDFFGVAATSLGDLDGDGINDIAVGAPRDDDGGLDRGAVHILFLNADGTVKAEQKISATVGGLTATIDDDDRFGSSVASIGDVDGDGVVDIAVGAHNDDDGGANSDRGAVHILFLNADGTVKAEQKISATAGGLTATLDDADGFGVALAGIGDVDNDGTSDVGVGAYLDDDGGANSDRGAAYILFLNPDGTVKAEQKISDTQGGLTSALTDNDQFGGAVAGLGDLDGDGAIDIAVGAIQDDDGGPDRGAVHVLNLAAGPAPPVNDAPTFGAGGDGVVTTAIGTSNDDGMNLAVQSDGKILVAGSSTNAGNSDFALTRYNADGTLDTSFSNDGKLTTAIGSGTDYGMSVAVQADGKIVVAGSSHNGSNMDFAVARYNTDGSLDTGFSGDGTLMTAIGAGDDWAQSVTVQPDGKILVAGYSQGASDSIALVRYNADGSLDTSFSGDGILTTDVGSGFDRGYSVAVQGDGKIVLAGSSHNGSLEQLAVVRYNADGTLDSGFSGDGSVTTSVGAVGARVYGVTVQPDGKILVSGSSHNGSNMDFTLARYNDDGTLDTSFSGDGILTTGIGSGDDWAFSVALQSDGKIVAGGYSNNGSDDDFAVVRYNADGTLDTSFSGDGLATTPIGAGEDRGQRGISVQPDGKILVAGHSHNGTDNDFALVRYNADGTLDTTFDPVTTLDASPAYVEDGAATVLDANVNVSDPQLDALNSGLGNYSGASLTLARNAGAAAEDVFAFNDGNGITSSGGNLIKNAQIIATFDITTTPGELVVTFTDVNGEIPTSLDVDNILRQITYANSSDSPPVSAQIDWTFDDGNSGSQGSGGPLSVTGSTTVAITAANDAPVLADDTPTLNAINEDDFTSSGDSVAAIVVDGSITDVDGSPVESIAITAVDNANGTWQYSTDNGGSWSNVDDGALAVDHALLLDGTLTGAATHKLRFVPSADYNGSATITFRAWDMSAGAAASYADTTTSGGSTPYSTATDTASIAINAVNDAPTLSGGPYSLSGTDEDTTSTGVQVSTVLGGLTPGDSDGDTLGLAVTTATGNGTWQYSTDSSNGSDGTWTNFGAVAGNSALLLSNTSWVRYVPDTVSGETASLTFHAWDGSTGSASTTGTPSTADPAGGGGTTAYSSGTAQSNLVVSDVNDAPGLSDNTPGLTAINEDDVTSTGDSVAAIVVNGSITDVDGSPVESIAITAVDNTNGTWQYSTDNGGSWSNVDDGALAVNHALLLDGTLAGAATQKLRFVPSADYNGSATITFRAWDMSAGAADSYADTTTSGGSTPYSTATDTASIAINAVNDEPTLTATASNPTFTEDGAPASVFSGASASTVEAGQTFSALTVTVSNVSDGADEIFNADGSAIALTHGNSGTTATNSLSYSVSIGAGTATLTLNGGALNAAQLQTLIDALSYENDSDNPATSDRVVTLTEVKDSGGTANSGDDTATVNIVSTVSMGALNDAPTLSGGPYVLSGINEDTTSTGVQVSTVVGGLTSNDTEGDTLGLAVTTAAGNGTWQYSTDSSNGSDGTWTNFGAVAGNSALLLSNTTWVRYVPDTVSGETASLTFHAWDGSTGSASTTGTPSTADPAGGGGTTAYSSGTAQANLVVSDVNDAPGLSDNTPGLTAINEDDVTSTGDSVAAMVVNGSITDVDGSPVESIAITAVDNANGTWQYSTDNGGSWSNVDDGALAVDHALLLDGTLAGAATQKLRFVPSADYNGSATITFRAWDMSAGAADSYADTTASGGSTPYSTATDTASIAINAVNDAPTLSGGPYSLSGTDEDSTSTGVQVSTVLGGLTSNDTEGDTLGLAVTTAAGNGTWQYSTDSTDGSDGSWTGFGPVAGNSALLLSSTTWARYVPDGVSGETASLTFHAWDGTSGSASATATPSTADPAGGGGITAFSSGTAQATLSVSDVNDAPVLADASPVLSTIAEDDVTSAGDSVAAIVVDGSVTDADGAAVESIAITAVDDANGTWQFSTDNGGSWSNVDDGALAVGHALLLDGTLIGAATHKLRFVPDPDYNGSADVTFRAWDMSGGIAATYADTTASGGTTPYSSAVDTASVTIDPVNDAPTLSATASNPTFTEDGAPASLFTGTSASTVESGQSFASLTLTVSNVSDGADEILNADGSGIGLVHGASGTTLSNSLSYSVSVSAGTATLSLSGGTLSAAQLQGLIDTLSYQNDSDNPSTANRVVTLTSVEDSGGTANGGDDTTALSIASTVTVSAVNDAPVNTVPGPQSIPMGGSVVFNAGTPTEMSIADVDVGAGTLQVTLRAGGGTLTLANIAGLGFSSGTGIAERTMIFSGTVAGINAALDGMVFNADPGFYGFAGITLDTDDQGNSPGPALADLDSVSIAVAGAEQQLWLTFEDDDAATGNPDIPSITGGSVVGFGNITALEPGITTGDFAYLFNLDSHADDGDARVDAVHRVGHDITVGSNAVALRAGDLLFSTKGDEDIGGITYGDKDVLLFRPAVPGIYTIGTITRLIGGADIGLGDVTGITLVEHDTRVGDMTLNAGEFLIAHDANASDLVRFRPGLLGATTSGALDLLLDGSQMDIGPKIAGVHLVQLDTDLGPTALTAGQILLALSGSDGSVGDLPGPIAVERQDVFVLDVTATELGGGVGASAASATRLFEGLDESLDSSQESIWGVSLGTTPPAALNNQAPTVSVHNSAFINELHYDNVGADTGEFVEIAALAGTDLTGWNLAFYNGANGKVYRTTALSGVVADLGSGMGTLSFTLPPDGIRNSDGAADGIALVDAAGTVLEFISYEDTLTALDGPAAGLNSTDIKVAENGATPAGHSLQLTGAGSTFGWLAATPETPAAANSGQFFPAAANALTEQVPEGGTLAFGIATGNAITVADADAGVVGDPLQTTLTVGNGTLTLAGTLGLSSLSGNGTASVSFAGTAAEINAALDGLSYQPAGDFAGTDLLTILVDDGGNTGIGGALTDSGQVRISVTPVNDAPTFSTLGNQTVNEDSGPHTVAGFASALPGGGVDEAGQTFSYNVSNDNPGLFAVAPDIDANGQLTYTLNSNLSGNATVTVSVADSGGTANGGADTSPTQRFDIAVAAVNDAPSLNLLGDQGVLEDSGAHSVAGFASALPGGGADEAGQTFSYTVGNDNPGLFAVGPAIDGAGQLTYTLAANAVGTASVTVSVTDSGGTANGGTDTLSDRTFDIIVTAVNDAPSFTTLGDQSVDEDSGAHSVTGFASALSGGGADEVGQTFSYSVASNNPGLFAAGPAIDGSGQLTYTLNANVSGTATVTVSMTDSGGTANGGVDAAPAQAFDIVVAPVNDVPAFTTLGTQSVLEDSGAHSVAGFASALPGGGADEAGQTFSYTVGNDNPGLFAVGPAIDGAGQLTYTLAANAVGTASVTVSVTDSGGTANGGFDTSADQSFDIIVTPVNDAPSGGDATLSTLQDTGYVFSAADFGFSDPVDGDALVAVEITTLPGAGTLTNNGLVLAASDTVSAADIAAGRLVFTPMPGESKSGYASFTFRVQDDGGTAGGGFDLDPVANRLTIDVRPAPDPGPVVPGPGSGPVVPASPASPPAAPAPDPDPVEALPPLPFFEPGLATAPPEQASPAAIELDAGAVAQSLPEPEAAHARAKGGAPIADPPLPIPVDAEVELSTVALQSADSERPEFVATRAGVSLALDRVRNAMDEENGTRRFEFGQSAGAALGLSVGYVSWLLRGGVLLSSVLSSLPAWRFIDPLPVFSGSRRRTDDEDEGDDDESLHGIVEGGATAKPPPPSPQHLPSTPASTEPVK